MSETMSAADPRTADAGAQPDPTGSRSTFSISDAAQMVGVSAGTIRIWEREGLVRPTRTTGGHRVFGHGDIARLRQIQRLRVVEGLNIRAIAQRLDEEQAVPADPAQSRHGSAEVIGRRLRSLREKLGMTLAESARNSGLSISFISSVERGQTGFSLASLRALASAYGAEDIPEIFGLREAAPQRLVRDSERSVMKWANGVRFEEMAVGPNAMYPQVFAVGAHASSGGAYSHGGEEFIFIISGILYVELLGEQVYELNEGDTLYFPSRIPHSYWAGESPVRGVWTNSETTL